MVDVLGPTIHQSGWWRRIQLTFLHFMGAVLGSVLAGFLLGWLGQRVLRVELDTRASSWMGIVVLLLALLADLTVSKRHTPTLVHRQVPPGLFARGALRTSFVWGFDLGLGLSTRWPSFQLFGLGLLCFLTQSPLGSMLLFGSFGLVRGLVTIFAAWLVWQRAEASGAICLIPGQPLARLLPSLVALGCILFLVSSQGGYS